MTSQTFTLGIDIGSISISLVLLDTDYRLIDSHYRFHNGQIETHLAEMLSHFDPRSINRIGITSSTPDIFKHATRIDDRVAYICAAKENHFPLGSLLIVGGEKFGIAQFDEHGNYLNFRSNSSCAAGTGSFLDQQARRLNLSGIEEFCRLALANQGSIPKIASRCAVFAKTDLIHAQQEGYSLKSICDGLSYGLAKNIVDTLFSATPPHQPIVTAGGVSKNQAVIQHLSKLLNLELIVDPQSHLYGAMGAAINSLESTESVLDLEIDSIEQIIKKEQHPKSYEYRPLALKKSSYPDFRSFKRYDFRSRIHPEMPVVETDIYKPLEQDTACRGFLGIDIGSTSTKAVLADENQEVLAGFYTRTSGRPVEAVQVIFEAIVDLFEQSHSRVDFIGVGTTGSGRKFIGEIIGADIALDEITAHARAAWALDPSVDTIIEIGGQDSKFTTVKNGRVTFSIMNTVCAAGTGSFIEEQAKKLEIPLDDYSTVAEGVSAPLSSDKCTVFMERDLNYYLAKGYSVPEILASVLHSVRDNYLTKVAIESNIGDHILFQGATAKNKSLVAAFEQKLQKPISVSRYCHLTGALGVALHLADQAPKKSQFRGLNLYRGSLPVDTEICDLCTNHCKIKTAVVDGQTVAFGFLCGRDYETRRYVKDSVSGFELIRSRKKVLRRESIDSFKEDVVIGLPVALHLSDDIDLWQAFFEQLSIRTITSDSFKNAVKKGKKLTGAEFCAPLTAMHAHVQYLTDKCDLIFLPDYLETHDRETTGRRQFCYYTQYAPALISDIEGLQASAPLLRPTLKTIRGSFHTKVELYKMLRRISRQDIGFFRVSSAYDRAVAIQKENRDTLKALFRSQFNPDEDIFAVLLGRPYTVLSSDMNARIPQIFDKLGVKAFFQDMLSYSRDDLEAIAPLLNLIHWHYAARIFEAAEIIAQTKGLYPVLITSFKCTPDAFVIETFKKILDARKKPYLILQLDEHDSSVGYETRIEAGIRAFRNHYHAEDHEQVPNYHYRNPEFLKGMSSLEGKTLLFPNFDYLPCKLIEASLRQAGIDARLMEETELSIRKSMSLNQGQCLPISMMAQSAIDTIEKYQLDPAKTVIWTIDSNISCNLGIIRHSLKDMVCAHSKALEAVDIYAGEITFLDMSIRITYNAYFAFMFGGLLKKMGCKTRPYELTSGETDAVIERSMEIFYNTFLNDGSKEDAAEAVVSMFEAIKTRRSPRPQVAIFGDLYARDNDVVNQQLIKTIEANGGEAITTPYSEYVRMISGPFIRKWMREGSYSSAAMAKVLSKTFPMLEKKTCIIFNRIIKEKEHHFPADTETILNQFGVSLYHTGESLETLLKIFTFIQNYPDIALFVQTSPSLCCPSLVTEAMAERIEAATDIPVVNIEYDGAGGSKNEVIVPYLKYPRKRESRQRKAQ